MAPIEDSPPGAEPESARNETRENDDKWWELVLTEVTDQNNDMNDLLEEILRLKFQATTTMIEFASIHGINFRHFKMDDDQPDSTEPPAKF